MSPPNLAAVVQGATPTYPAKTDPDVRHDLAGSLAIEKMADIVKNVNTCFFVAHGGVRPMGVRDCYDSGNVWFLSDKHSRKNAQVAADAQVELYLQGSERSGFMHLAHLAGTASISEDRALVDKLWRPLARAWFQGGKDDPCISIIRVQLSEGQPWDNKHGDAVAGVQMLIGAALGKPVDDGAIGALKP